MTEELAAQEALFPAASALPFGPAEAARASQLYVRLRRGRGREVDLASKPTQRYCCGDGRGTNPVACTDSRCASGGRTCTSQTVVPGSYCCGDTLCEAGESCGNCALDCRTNAVELCGNGTDDDCANGADCSDPRSASTPACQPTCGAPGAACSSNGQVLLEPVPLFDRAVSAALDTLAAQKPSGDAEAGTRAA